MTVLQVRYTVRQECVADVESGVQEIVTALESEQPQGIRYALCKLPDGVSFMGLLTLEDGIDNPLPGIAAGREFQHNLKSWVVGEPPTPQPAKVVGSYRLF
jgi:hypothetical protein